jgi:hypothetical protein
MIQPTISLELPVPSQGHYGFHSFPVVDWFCLFIYLWVLTFPLLDCSEFGNCVITLIYLFATVLSVLLWFTAFDYPIAIFKLFSFICRLHHSLCYYILCIPNIVVLIWLFLQLSLHCQLDGCRQYFIFL